MNIDELKQILEIVREHGITEFEFEREDGKVRIRKGAVEVQSATVLQAVTAAQTAGAAPAQPAAAAASGPTPIEGGLREGAELAIVKSPIVGTFYRAPEPGAKSFVEVGTTVRKGQVLCIIEAMKLMNEINCDYDGVIAAVYVENGQPVQYGERLFAIKK